jgi:DNA-directed RNA polymerase
MSILNCLSYLITIKNPIETECASNKEKKEEVEAYKKAKKKREREKRSQERKNRIYITKEC